MRNVHDTDEHEWVVPTELWLHIYRKDEKLMRNVHDTDKPECRHYRIVRQYFNRDRRPRTIKTGLTLTQAQKHCSDPETSSSTCTHADRIRYTRRVGPWFDSYTVE